MLVELESCRDAGQIGELQRCWSNWRSVHVSPRSPLGQENKPACLPQAGERSPIGQDASSLGAECEALLARHIEPRMDCTQGVLPKRRTARHIESGSALQSVARHIESGSAKHGFIEVSSESLKEKNCGASPRNDSSHMFGVIWVRLLRARYTAVE